MQTICSDRVVRSGLKGSVPLRLFLAVSLLWGAPTLACGSFAPRPTPTPSPQPTATSNQVAIVPTATATVVPLILEPTATPAPPTEAIAAASAAPIGLAPGAKALITAPADLNMRDQPTSSSRLIVRLGSGQRVTVVEGPVQAESFTWWKIDDGKGQSGWVAERDNETVWLTAEGGSANQPTTGTGGINPNARPVDRAPRVGDRVEVTMPAGSQLTIRSSSDRDSTVVTRVDPGTRFSVIGGPAPGDGYDWYQIQAEDGRVTGWAAGGDGRTRWLSPLE